MRTTPATPGIAAAALPFHASIVPPMSGERATTVGSAPASSTSSVYSCAPVTIARAFLRVFAVPTIRYCAGDLGATGISGTAIAAASAVSEP
jgi:hypothetical protein